MRIAYDHLCSPGLLRKKKLSGKFMGKTSERTGKGKPMVAEIKDAINGVALIKTHYCLENLLDWKTRLSQKLAICILNVFLIGIVDHYERKRKIWTAWIIMILQGFENSRAFLFMTYFGAKRKNLKPDSSHEWKVSKSLLYVFTAMCGLVLPIVA